MGRLEFGIATPMMRLLSWFLVLRLCTPGPGPGRKGRDQVISGNSQPSKRPTKYHAILEIQGEKKKKREYVYIQSNPEYATAKER